MLEGGKITALLRKYENLYCDISGASGYNALSRDTEHAKVFITEFQDRICYGRDYFLNNHQEFLNGLELPKEVLDKIYYKNAKKIIRGI